MQRTRFIEHKGKRLLLLDLSGITSEAEMLEEARLAREFIAKHPADGSLLTLTHTTGSSYSRGVVDALRDLTKHNRDYVKAGAVVTDAQLHRVVISTLALVVKRNLKAFEDLEAAKEWLITQ
jgi:hypothetical protein